MILLELFWGFLKVGFFAFGGAYGAIPLIRDVVLSYGWLNDENGITVLRVAGDARVTIPYTAFADDFRSTGKTIEVEFATRDVMNYDSVIMSCMSGGRGSIIGTVLGMLIIAVMNNLLNLIGVPPFLREAFKGLIVIVAVLLQKKDKQS